MSSPATNNKRTDGTGLIDYDPWLEPYADSLRHRYQRYQSRLNEIIQGEGSLESFSQGYKYFGFNRGECDGAQGVWYREWAPEAHGLFLTGDFNGWDRGSHPMTRDDFGVWSIFLPDSHYSDRLVHNSKVKVHVQSNIGPMDRVPAYAKYVLFDERTHDAVCVFWDPEPYQWKNPVPKPKGGLRIYEAHIGMALEDERIGTYRDFRERVLPRIAGYGYNAVQLMAIQEHPYYGSFGYHVSNFYAASSRFGTPYELKELIDAAHGMGVRVVMDIVHSHSVKNLLDGLNMFDGSGHHYFHAGARGEHPTWDSLLFDYSKWEVLRFLLSNVRFWQEEYRFDGFRFDGVTSMMYLDHGLGMGFNSYDDYLRHNIDEDAVTYLQLANKVAHEVNPDVISIAEDVSGMVGLGRELDEGGLGFDYRLAMGLPDYWIKLLKHRRDEDWNMNEIFHTLMNRRQHEKHIAYAESHDQALVGDKTIAFWLMDADMYWHMSRNSQNPVIDRGIAMHKMIRLVTFALGGEAYLNFIGNEFGHPEWVDFPREGNGYSFKYARRQWSLVDNHELRYGDLAAFDHDMLSIDAEFNILEDPFIELISVHEDFKLLHFRRGPLVFIFNWHPTRSVSDYRIGMPDPHDYQVLVNTDDGKFGGHERVPPGQVYPLQNVPEHYRRQSIQLYLPARTAQVLKPI